jgi:hypothetical protein
VKEYDGFKVAEGQHLNDKLALGENNWATNDARQFVSLW